MTNTKRMSPTTLDKRVLTFIPPAIMAAFGYNQGS